MRVSKELFQRVQREHLLQAIDRVEAGAETTFGASTKYDVVFKGKRFSPKVLVGMALQLLNRESFGPSDFKGGESTRCFDVLRRCGFNVVPKRTVEAAAPLKDVFAEILKLQTTYSSTNTPAMKRRGELIRYVVPDKVRDHVEEIEPTFVGAGYELAIEGSDGIGRKVASPWVRLFDPAMSSSATQGWYIVLHFSKDGRTFYLTVGCGATILQDGNLIDVPDEQLFAQIAWARERVARTRLSWERFQDPIRLRGNALSVQFEKATAFAKAYDIESFREHDFWADLKVLTVLLVALYEEQRLGKAPLSDPPEVSAVTKEAGGPSKAFRKGQGRGLTGPERKAVACRAMEVVRTALKDKGYSKVKDTSETQSYDFAATKDGASWKVEVKGTTSSQSDVIMLTANELALHRTERGSTILAIVFDIQLDRTPEGPRAAGGTLEWLAPWNPDEWAFEPTAYRAERRLSKA